MADQKIVSGAGLAVAEYWVDNGDGTFARRGQVLSVPAQPGVTWVHVRALEP